jgi:multicomponent Na+:H+ antiporter subunit D
MTMGWSELLPLLVILSSLLPSLLVLFLSDEQSNLRLTLYLGAEVVKLALVFAMLYGIYMQESYETRIPLLPGIDFLLRGDALGMLFLTLSAGLWLLTTLYSIGYLRDDPHRSRFYGFFGLCVTSTAGIALAGNLFTFFIFYEMLTLTTYPLVVHRDTPEAIATGRKYLAYTLGGGQVLLAGIVGLYVIAGSVEFTPTGVLSEEDAGTGVLTIIFILLIAGLGVKAALVPLHSWLPAAMIAPTPVSALLHGVAVVKAGAFGILRIIYEVFGIELSAELGVLFPLALIASFTIVYGSLRALAQDELKRLLAYSTVSQISYIVLGASLLGFLDTVGGVAHLVHQGIMKVTLFFCAGVLSETLGIHKVKEMSGVALRMPWTMAAFSLAAFGMIGLPPMAGFVSKWFLGVGAVEIGQSWAVAVLVASTLLNAAYFLPVVYAAWFKAPDREEWSEERPGTRFEADWLLLFPTVVLAALVLLVGIFAGLEISPLGWARLIATREWGGQLD